jgi:hypothetical protein
MLQEGSGFPGQLRRAAAVIALCAIAAIGVRAGSGATSGGNSWVAKAASATLYDVFGIGLGAALVAGAVLFALMMRMRRLQRKKRRSSAANSSVPWWLRLLLLAFVLLTIGGPVGLLAHDLLHGRDVQQPPSPRPGISLGKPSHASHYSGGVWPIATGMALALAALIIGAIVLRRRRRAELSAAEAEEPDAEDVLRDALSAGAEAMRKVADPRGAIIACYAAMEQHLARAGAEPAAADTPAEILARAAAGGLVRSSAAGELTGLFRQARYGGAVMTEAARTAAEDALARLRADLASAWAAQEEAARAEAEKAAAETAGAAPTQAGP